MKNIYLEYSSYSVAEWCLILCISPLQNPENTVVGSSYLVSLVLLAVWGVHSVFLSESYLIYK